MNLRPVNLLQTLVSLSKNNTALLQMILRLLSPSSCARVKNRDEHRSLYHDLRQSGLNQARSQKFDNGGQTKTKSQHWNI